MSEFTPKQWMKIPTPMRSIRPRGVYANKTTDPLRSIRIDNRSYEAIQEAAALIGVTASELIRVTAYMAANDILAQYNEHKRKIAKQAPVTAPKTPFNPYK